MIDEIPITFECKGEVYRGELSMALGAGSGSTYFLMINNYYCGVLCYGLHGWAFYGTPKTKEFEELASFFEMYLVSWYS